ncbi:MAG: DNA translocase FtsK, partial [Gemmiger sp.]
KKNADILVNTLDSFGVKTTMLDICRGPSVTRYELQPQAGIKVSRITSLADDIALNLATAGVRIEAPIPGKPAVGIEVPNKIRSTVNIRAVFESQNYINMRSPLTMALGKDIAGAAQVADLCKMPHLLIAGSTGSGKSVCVNSIIISFLFRSSPEDVKLILIDPKVVELAEYNGIPHLLMPVVTEPRKAAGALGASVAEMERRYKLFAENNVREIKAYNKLAAQAGLEHLPYIAIVIDELADLMMVAGKEVEDYICRIAQKARAAGIHLIVATQRPSVDVITGLIKANIPSRIAFAVSSQIDSRTILDASGAEKLLGYGDMLFLPVGASKPVRVQGTFVTDEEIGAVLSFIKSTSSTQYDEEMIAEMERRAVAEKGSKKGGDDDGEAGGALDPMFEQAVECVIDAGQASTSLLQRRCKLGYARAARIMDQMEQEKIIGPYEGAKPRSVLVSKAQWEERKLNGQYDEA